MTTKPKLTHIRIRGTKATVTYQIPRRLDLASFVKHINGGIPTDQIEIYGESPIKKILRWIK